MITLDERIARTQRWLRRLDEDRPYLRARVAALGPDHRKSVSTYAARVRAEVEAELQRLEAQKGIEYDATVPQPAD